MNKNKTKAPFGVQTKRFIGIGLHPSLDPSGALNSTKSKLGPGQYNPKVCDCAYKNRLVSGSWWKRKTDLEEYSQNLGFRNAAILEQRKFRRSMGGPGTYDVPESRRQSNSCMRNVSFGRDKRFRVSKSCDFPPPGTYTAGLSLKPKRQFTPLPSFEWDGFVDRLKSVEKPWTKPPNLYNPEDRGCLKAMLERVVSKRGPYDLFTGPRDDSTIKNHFAPSKFKGPLNFFYVWPTELDTMLWHPKNKNKGRFFQEVRFGVATQRHMIGDPTQVKKNPNEPNPMTYDVSGPPKEVKENKYAFNQSVAYPRPPVSWKISPGVGRYNPKTFCCSQIKRKSWVFKSTIGRPEYKGPSYSAF